MKEKEKLTKFIQSLEFNNEVGGRFLVMISGDMHMLSYDLGPAPGEKNLKTNEAPFPIFQCAPLDKKASCKSGMTWSAYPSFGNSQYCVFEFR